MVLDKGILLLEITDRLYHNIDISELNGVIFLDLRKAFDIIDHQIMLKKLRCYGIAGTGFHLIYPIAHNIVKLMGIYLDCQIYLVEYHRGQYLVPRYTYCT